MIISGEGFKKNSTVKDMKSLGILAPLLPLCVQKLLAVLEIPTGPPSLSPTTLEEDWKLFVDFS